jgi:hypothetical protein
MKHGLSLINLAVDSAAMFVAFLAWTFSLWLPVIVGIALLIAGPPLAVSIVILVLFIFVFIPLGLLLKWLSIGIIERRRWRITSSIFVLTTLSVFMSFAPLIEKQKSSQNPLDELFVGVALLVASAAVSLGLAKGAQASNDRL